MFRPCSDLWYVKNSADEEIGLLGLRASSREFTCQSLSRSIQNARPSSKDYSMFIREVSKVAPRSPVSLIKSIRQANESEGPINPEQLEKWKAKAGESSDAWSELALAYQRIGNKLATIDCFLESIRLSPELSVYHELAEAYQRFNMKDKVVPLYQEYLNEVESFGLEHSNVHAYIAIFYTMENDLDAAKPHAIKAAQSYSGRGLLVAANVCELREEFDEADRYYEALSSNYPSRFRYVLVFVSPCSRDTKDFKGPRKIVDQWFAASPNWKNENHNMIPDHLLDCRKRLPNSF